MNEIVRESLLVCTVCGFTKSEMMPSDACQFYYECAGCKTVLRPKAGDCCVFCSYGSVKCPPMQGENCICLHGLSNSLPHLNEVPMTDQYLERSLDSS